MKEDKLIWIRELPNGKPFPVSEELSKKYSGKKNRQFEIVDAPPTPETVESLLAKLSAKDEVIASQTKRIAELEKSVEELKKKLPH